MTVVRGLRLGALGAGAGYALYGFRAAAMSRLACPDVTGAYEEAFGPAAPVALAAVERLSRSLCEQGGRRILLAAPGCSCVTADELSVAAALAAAQAGRKDERDAHLAWLTGWRAEEPARRAADMAAAVFARAGLRIAPPPVEIFASPKDRRPAIHPVAGAA